MHIKALGLRVILAALLGVTVLNGVPAAWQGGWSNSSMAKGHSVVVTGPNSPNFDDVLERWFPGVTGVDNYATVKPLLAIVHNNTLRTVKAYAVRWIITNADGSTSTEYLSVVSDPGPGEAQLTGSRTVLGQGNSASGTQLVSPYFNWPESRFTGLLQINAVMISFQAASREPLASNIQAATRFHPTLDGAIFGDGAFIGPDTSGLYERFKESQQAEVDEAEWLLSQLSANLTDQQVGESLSGHIYQGCNSAGADPTSLYRAARGEAARRFVSVLQKEGKAGLGAVATRLASAKPTMLHRLGGAGG